MRPEALERGRNLLAIGHARLTTLAGLTILAAGVATTRPDLAAKGAAGLAAHSICSAVFVSGQDEQRTFDQLVAPLAGPAARALSIQVDRAEHKVDATFAGLWRETALFSQGFGCRLSHDQDTPLPAAHSARAGTTQRLLFHSPVDPALQSALNRVFAEVPGQPPKQVRAVVILHDGAILGERYAQGAGPATPLLSWSVAKSFTNALLGILVREGKQRWPGWSEQRSALDKWIACRLIADMGRHGGRA